MQRLVPVFVLLFLLPLGLAQPPPADPDLGPVVDVIDDAAGDNIPTILELIEGQTGEELDREDIRVGMDMEFTKGEVNLLGFLVGSARTEITAHLEARIEIRVVSSDRIRALVEGENPYNATAENTTFLSTIYIPADVFRASFSGSVIDNFKADQEDALEIYFRRTFPELQMSDLGISWSNIRAQDVIADEDIFEPPIIADVEMTLNYLRVDSIDSLVASYFDARQEPGPRRQYIADLKKDAGDPLRSRDFFSAAAYSQLVNLTAQPGWAIDIDFQLPRGYEFTYFNEEVSDVTPRTASIHLDALDQDGDAHRVYLASITHKRGVAATLFVVMWAVGLLLATPGRLLYSRRLRRLAKLDEG